MSDPNRIRVLFLASNPKDLAQLDLEGEVAEIRKKIEASEFGDEIEIVPHLQPTRDGLIQLFNEDDDWDIIHYSGHGSESHELMLVGEDGGSKPVSKEALTRLFSLFGRRARLVVLNACFAEGQAEVITRHVDCAVGMSRAVSDAAAVLFAASLYRGIGFGKSVADAFAQGKLAIDMEGLSDVDTPQLRARMGFDPGDLRFLVGTPAPQVEDEWLRLAPPPPDLNEGQKWHAFLSYRSVNRTWVLNLHDVLRRHGYDLFLDQFAIQPGAGLEERLADGLENSRVGILVWSPASADSEWCMKELATMTKRREEDPSFRFVTLHLGGELPEAVSGDVRINFSGYPDGPNGRGLLELLFALAGERMTAEAVHFANQQDEEIRDSENAIEAAVSHGDAGRLSELFEQGGVSWRSSPVLGGRVAEALAKLAEYDRALAVLDEVQARFPRSVRPKQMRALALARRGSDGDLKQAQEILAMLRGDGNEDPETLGIYARTWMDMYRTSNKKGHLLRSRKLYADAFEHAPDDTYTGINAAAKSVFLGKIDEGRGYARRVLDALQGREPADYWEQATLGEAHLILGDYAAAAESYEEAVIDAFEQKGSLDSTLKQARSLKAALEIPEESWEAIEAAFDV